MGGIVEVNTARDSREGFHGQVVLSGGSFDTAGGYTMLQYLSGKNLFGISASGAMTSYYLSPPVTQNFTNTGTTGDFAGRYERDLSQSDRLTLMFRHELARYDIPNEQVQQAAGQRQNGDNFENLGIATYQHIFSSNVVADFRAMVRDNSSGLSSNPSSTPIIAFQANHFNEGYFNGTVSIHRGNQEWKAGVESDNLFLHEHFADVITDPSQFAIFAFVDAVLIKPLPYRDPARLVGAYETNATFPRSNLSFLDFFDWRARNTVFQSFDAFRGAGYMLSTPAGAQAARGARITDGFFRTLGVTPVLGRDFYPGEDSPSAARATLLSYSTWQQRYGGRRDILGQTAILDGDPYVIVGVLPREFHFAPVGAAEFWTAYNAVSGCETRRSCHNMYGVARFKDGVSLQAAIANVLAIAKELEREHPDSNRDQGANLVPLTEVLVGEIRPILMVLLSGAGLLLVIAAVNVAGLMLLRSEGRQKEIAVRTALGASSGRLIGQFVTESVVLVGAGAALGLLSAYLFMHALQGLISQDLMARMPFFRDLELNRRVLSLAGAIAAAAAILLSLPPATRVWSSRMRAGLADASRGSAGTVWRRLGSKLVVLELATAMVLLVGAGLLGKSLYQLLHVNVGMQPDHLVTIDVASPSSTYREDAKALALAREVTSRIERLPGVTSVGVAENGVPLSGNGNTTWFHVAGRPWHGEHYDSAERYVSANYFATLGATLVRGRYFGESDDASKPLVAIVNRAFVKRYFPGEEPLGRQLVTQSTPPTLTQIVDIVDDIREGPLDVVIPPVIYGPFNQSPDNYFSLVVRTVQSENLLLPAMSAAIRGIDPAIVPLRATTMTGRINDSQSAYLHGGMALLVGGFALLALLLGVVGLYGVIAYSVSQRNREIGIRMALGAQVRSVYGLILREAGWLTVFGIAVGLGGAMAAATLMRSLLFGVSSWDVPTLAGVAAVLGMAALLASFIPARRAASVNPADALRSE